MGEGRRRTRGAEWEWFASASRRARRMDSGSRSFVSCYSSGVEQECVIQRRTFLPLHSGVCVWSLAGGNVSWFHFVSCSWYGVSAFSLSFAFLSPSFCHSHSLQIFSYSAFSLLFPLNFCHLSYYLILTPRCRLSHFLIFHIALIVVPTKKNTFLADAPA